MPVQLDTAKIVGERYSYLWVMNDAHFPLIASLLNAENKDGVHFMMGEFLELLISLVCKSYSWRDQGSDPPPSA